MRQRWCWLLGAVWAFPAIAGEGVPPPVVEESPRSVAAAAAAPRDVEPAARAWWASASEGAPGALSLDEVVRSAILHHPLIRVAESGVDEQDAAVTEAWGAFDPEVKAGVTLSPLGYYERRGGQLGVNQRLPVLGSPEVFGGWRAGTDWAPYEGKEVTGTWGELKGGVRFQLSKDLFIDEGRLKLRVTRLKRVEAEAKRRLVELKVADEATKAYLKWAVAVQKLGIGRGLLRLAEDRQGFIEKQVAAGALPRIAIVDNQRQIFARLERVATLERDAAAAALFLGLFLRDGQAQPQSVEPERAPALLDPRRHELPIPPAVEALLERALEQRPELAAYAQVRRVLAAELELAENNALPKVELELAVSQDLGQPQPYGPSSSRLETEAMSRLSISWPVLMLKARGQQGQRLARLRAVQAEVGLLEDTIRQEVRAAFVAWEAAQRRWEVSVRALDAARQMEAAERARLLAGSSDLLSVNLREEQAALSAEKLAEAAADRELAYVALQLRAGRLPSTSP